MLVCTLRTRQDSAMRLHLRCFVGFGWFWGFGVEESSESQNHMNPQRMRREHLSRAAAACYWSLGTKRCRVVALLCKLLADWRIALVCASKATGSKQLRSITDFLSKVCDEFFRMVWMDLSSGIQTEINVEAKQTAATAEERSLNSPGTR